MDIRYFRYPWRVSFTDLAEEGHTDLPVASGACFVLDEGDEFHASLPKRSASIGERKIKIYELPDTDDKMRISVFAHSGERICASLGAYGGLRTDRDENASDLNELIDESLRFVQRIEEIIETEHRLVSAMHPCVSWSTAIEKLASTDWRGDLARKPLIVELAERQGFPLKEIARGAKRLLRRVRAKERLSRAREFDKATLIRIAQLPGRTIAQKAGPRQHIPAVKRYETTDTLENRVVEHFCRLAEGEWRRTQKNGRTELSGEWQTMADSFVQMCRRVEVSEDFSRISKLKSPCTTPNYTLEQNINYRSIWSGYQRLIRRQTEREECWAWARRVFLSRTLIFAGELFDAAFPSGSAKYIPYHKHLRARLSQTHGLWLDTESFPGPRVFQKKESQEHFTAYFLSPHDLENGPEYLRHLAVLNADGYNLLAFEDRMVVSPIYCFVGGRLNDSLLNAYQDLRRVYGRFNEGVNTSGHQPFVFRAPILLWADFLRPGVEINECDEGIMSEGIPVINDLWVSPSARLVSMLRKVMTS